MSSRERTLALAMGGVVFVLLNLVLLRAFARANIDLRASLAQGRAEMAGIQSTLAGKDLWAARDAALTAKQPALSNENAAGVQLLDLIRGIARQHSVTLENEVVGVVVKENWYRTVPVQVDAHSSWPSLVSFLYALQKPDQFLVCEDANLQVDPGDQTKMVCHFKIARWYAP